MVVKPCKTSLEATSPGSKNARAPHLPAIIEYSINIEYENNINRRHKTAFSFWEYEAEHGRGRRNQSGLKICDRNSGPKQRLMLVEPINNNIDSLVAQTVKNLPALWETWVRSLGWEDPLEEGMATHSRIPAWRTPMNRGAWRAAVHGWGAGHKE